MSDPDPRAERPDVCGVTETFGSTEFVCVRPVHSTEAEERRGPIDGQGNPARWRRHYFVNRWPNRGA